MTDFPEKNTHAPFANQPETAPTALPADDGAWSEEVATLRHGCGVVDFSGRPLLDLLGKDRARFLNGQMTCDLRNPQPGEGTYGFFTTAKGRIEADAAIAFLEDRLVLELPASASESITQRLAKYIIFDQVTIQRQESTAVVVLAGPQAHRWLEPRGDLPAKSLHHVEGTCLGRSGRILRRRDLGVDAFSFWIARDEAPELLRDLSLQGDDGPRPVGALALDTVRIQAGVPWFGRDFGPETLPQETGLDDAVSYEKGCYLGQEIVARLHYRGQVSKQLRRLSFGRQEPPAADTELYFEGRPAGQVTSSARGLDDDHSIGLGMVQRRAFEAGTELEVVGGEAARVLAR